VKAGRTFAAARVAPLRELLRQVIETEAWLDDELELLPAGARRACLAPHKCELVQARALLEAELADLSTPAADSLASEDA
jgi:hypothetical protein